MAERSGETEDLPPKREIVAEPNIFQRIISLFIGANDKEAEKKRLIKQISRELSKSRYKFFKPRGDEALPGLARFFYETYKLVAPAQVLLSNAESSGTLRSFIIESFLTQDQMELQERLYDESIKERSKTMPTKDLQDAVKDDLVMYFSIFDTEKAKLIDEAYNTLLSFVRFANFDYYFLLKKFDSSLVERDFNYHPRFEAISGEYVAEDVKDFLEVFHGLNLDSDWRHIFEALKEYRNIDVVNVDSWIKFANALKDLRRSQVLEDIVRFIEKNPFFQSQVLVSNERIVDTYLQKMKTQTDVLIQKIIQEKRNGKVEELARQIFGTSAISRMKNYTDKANTIFAKKMLGGFVHVQALNFLKAFLLDFFKKDIRELVDLLLIRGQWSTNLNSQMLSESFHTVMGTSENLLQFDDSLADDGELGIRLRSAMVKADRDKEQIKFVRTMLKDINDKAQGLINAAAINLIAMGKTLKTLLEDHEKTPHELIINWKEVELGSEIPIKNRILDVYKKIYYFVQLMQFFIKGNIL